MTKETSKGTSPGASTGASTGGDGTRRSRRRRELERRRVGHRALVRKSERRERAQRRRTPSVHGWVGTFGLVGWTVTIPTLLGLALGAFLDDRLGGRPRFTVSFLLVGVLAGGATAWFWIRREIDGHGRRPGATRDG